MTFSLHKSGATKAIVGFHVRKAGVTKPAQTIWLRTGGALKQILGRLSVTLSRDTVSGRANSAGSTTVSTSTVAAVPDGAIGAVSYLWTRTDGGAHSWTIDAPTFSGTNFRTLAAPDEEWGATFHCTITDSAGQSITSSDVTASAANIYFYGGGGPYP